MDGEQGADQTDISPARGMLGLRDEHTMFSKLFGYFKKEQQLRSWRRSVLGKAINEHTRSHFAKGHLRHFEKQNKNLLAADLRTRILTILECSNPIIKCREELASSVIAFAGLEVLCITQQEKEKNFLYNNMKLVSADLQGHMLSCAPYNENIMHCVNEHIDVTEGELTRIARDRCAVYSYYANGFNIVRCQIESVKERDWFWPFVMSSMVVSEDNYRKYNRLPALATAIDISFHSNFVNIVLSGEQDPLLSWERRYGIPHGTAI